MLKHISALVGLFVTAIPVTAQPFTNKVTTTPIAIQDGFGPGGRSVGFNGLAYCGPTAFNMAIGYLGVNGYGRLAPLTPTAPGLLNRERILAGFAQSSATGGTYLLNLQSGIDMFLQAKGISLSDRTWSVANRPYVDDLVPVNVAPTVNVLLLGWYQLHNGAYQRVGGHFITLLDQSPNANGTGTITINNPDPSSLMPASDTPAYARQTLDLRVWPHTSTDLPGPPYMSSGRPGFLEFSPSQFPGYLSSAAVLETSVALTISPSVRDAGYPMNPWSISTANTPMNTNGGDFEVIAPMNGAGGIQKLGLGTLTFSNSCDLTGLMSVSGGTMLSTRATGTPIGTGSVRLDNGGLTLMPDGVGGAVNLTGVTGASTTFTFASGAVLSLKRGGNSSLSYTVGGGSGAVLVRQGPGTLVISPSSGNANLGTLEQFLVNGTTPGVTNGMVAASIVGQDNDANRSGDFLTYGAGGFARTTAYVQSTATPVTAVTNTTVYDVNSAQTIPAGQIASLQAIRVGAFTVGGGAGSTLNIAGHSNQAGLILNGGTISVPTLGFGASDLLAYTSGANGAINSSLTGTGRFVKFGPGTLTLGAAGSYTGATFVQTGTLRLAANDATANSSVTVQPAATLSVAPNVQVAGPITVLDGGFLNLENGSKLTNGLAVAAPAGTVIANGNPVIAAGSGSTTINGIFQAGAERGTTTFQGATTFTGSSQYLVRLYQVGSGLTNLLSSSIHFENPELTNFGSSGSYVNVTLDLYNVPTPDSGDPFWNANHSWVIADAATGWNNMFYDAAFIGYSQGNFTVTNDSNLTTLTLNYTFAPIPEPGTLALVGVAGLAAWGFRRRRKAGITVAA